MGVIVRAFDVKAVTKEQVESMGAMFLEVDLEGGMPRYMRLCRRGKRPFQALAS
jgi:NAD/NADP transhydrogenase alpha subunit